MEFLFAEPPILRTKSTILRAPSLSDVDSVTGHMKQPEISEFIPFLPYPYQRENAVDWVQSSERQLKAGEGITWAIALFDEPGTVIGSISLRFSSGKRIAEVGYWIAKDQWGKGIATEVAQTVVRFGFEVLGLHRIEARCVERNLGSANVLMKCNLSLEALQKEASFHRDKFESRLRFGLLNPNPAAERAGEPIQPSQDPMGAYPNGDVDQDDWELIPTLDTPRLHLRAIELDEIDAMIELMNDCDFSRYVPEAPSTIGSEYGRNWVGNIPRAWLYRRALVLGIRVKTPNGQTELAGEVAAFFRFDMRVAMIGYWLGRPYQGSGYATEAAKAMVEYCFQTLDAHRVEARCLESNVASSRVLLKCGLEQDGRLIDGVFHKGKFETWLLFGALNPLHSPFS